MHGQRIARRLHERVLPDLEANLKKRSVKTPKVHVRGSDVPLQQLADELLSITEGAGNGLASP